MTDGPNRTTAADGVSKTAEAIHHEITIPAVPVRVYGALTEPARFSAMTKFSSVPNAAPAVIASAVGGAFSLFDGHIRGRHIELEPTTRIVQAWRAEDWPPGVYSIVRFELRARDATTLIVFDHTGFPTGKGEHLAQGWHANYWTPMRKYLT